MLLQIDNLLRIGCLSEKLGIRWEKQYWNCLRLAHSNIAPFSRVIVPVVLSSLCLTECIRLSRRFISGILHKNRKRRQTFSSFRLFYVQFVHVFVNKIPTTVSNPHIHYVFYITYSQYLQSKHFCVQMYVCANIRKHKSLPAKKENLVT